MKTIFILLLLTFSFSQADGDRCTPGEQDGAGNTCACCEMPPDNFNWQWDNISCGGISGTGWATDVDCYSDNGTAHLEIQNVNLSEGTLDIYMSNDVPVAAFQFYLPGLELIGASGGNSEEADFFIMQNETMTAGFDIFAQNPIPVGEGVLISISFSGYELPICMPFQDGCEDGYSETDCPLDLYYWGNEGGIYNVGDNNPILSDIYANSINVTVGDCYSDNGTAHLEIQNVNLSEGTLDIYMSNDVPVAAFMVKISGIQVSDAYGGTAESADFSVDVLQGSQSGFGNVLGFSLEGNTIPPGEGLLTTVVYSEYEDVVCIELCDFEDWGGTGCSMLSDANANEIPLTVGECFENIDDWVYGCTYETATNYNPDATFDDGSCEFLWGDMNHDGTLNVQDVLFLVNAILSGDWLK